MALQKYNINFRVIQQSGVIPSNCNSITFINTGVADTVKVNTFPIAPGQTLSIDGNAQEIDDPNYLIELGATEPGPFFILTKTSKN